MKVVILAVTKMQGDRICIAGINEESQWVRPVREYPQHMEINDIFDKNTKKPIYEVFNVVEIPVTKKTGVSPHTEDVLIDLEKNPQVVGKIPVPEREAFLIKHCENELFKGQSEPINELLEKSNRSLILVGPAKLHRAVLKIDKTPRLDFDIPGYANNVSRPCTDLKFIALCKHIVEEKKAQEVIFDSAQLASVLRADKIFLGLGLSRKFEGAFHTMIVGLHTIPDYDSEDDLKNPLNRYVMTDMYSEKTKEVEEDIQKQLKTTCKVFRASFDRPNLYIEIIPLERNIKKESFLVNLLNRLNGQTIVFVTYQRTSEKISEILNLNGIKSVYYHAGLDREIREKIQNQFISGECKIIVATIAFGMGIDKADIRNIIHYNLPQSIESYYQEIGRAGRDGERSNCFVLFTKSDEHKLRSLISSDWPNEKKIKDIISYLKSKNAAYFFTTPKKISLDCDVKEIPTRLILHRLEEYGAIKIFTNIIYQTKPVFNKNYSKIVEDNPKYKNELEKIFSCEFFNDKRRTWLFLEEIMDKTGLNYFKILEVLNHLEKDGCLEFSETSRKDMILVKEKIKDVDITPLVNLFDSMLNHDLGKIDLLIKSITQQRCIRKNILEYFNEPKVKDTCGMCSHCVGQGLIKDIKPEINENYASDEEIEKLIDLKIDHGKVPLSLLIIVAQYKEIPRKDFIKILIGTLHRSSSAWKFKLGCYGILDTFKDQPSILEEILEGLINKELISEEMDGTLRITKIGLTHLNSVNEKNETTIEFKKEITKDVQNCKQIKDNAAYKSEGQGISIIGEESKEQSTESPNAAFLILGLIKNLDFHAGRTLLAEILIGSKSKKLEEIRQNPKILSYYGNLRKFIGDNVTDLIDQLIAKGYLIKKQGSSNFPRPLLYLTELAEKALEDRATIDLRLPVKNTIIESGNLNLLNELKVWRKNVAFKKNIPAYCIFHNSTLIDISNIKPQNMEELKAIKGVGANKINNYGQDILTIINRCN